MEELIKRIESTNKKIMYRYGFAYRGAESYEVTKESMIKSLRGGGFAHYDVKENEDSILVNFYSDGDMF